MCNELSSNRPLMYRESGVVWPLIDPSCTRWSSRTLSTCVTWLRASYFGQCIQSHAFKPICSPSMSLMLWSSYYACNNRWSYPIKKGRFFISGRWSWSEIGQILMQLIEVQIVCYRVKMEDIFMWRCFPVRKLWQSRKRSIPEVWQHSRCFATGMHDFGASGYIIFLWQINTWLA